MINADVSVKIQKNIMHAKIIIFGILPHSCENVEYLTSTIDGSVIMCDEIIYRSANVMSTVSSIFYKIFVRYKTDCYIFHTLLLMIILLLIIAIICYHHAKHRSKLQNI